MASTPLDAEQELVLAARRAPEGDARAFEQLVSLHHRRILANCRFLTRDESHFEDLAQEVFVKAYFALKNFEGNSSFGHWLKRIKVNHCLNHIKRGEGRDMVGVEEPGVEQSVGLRVQPEAEKTMERLDDQRRISGILEMMPATLRVVLVMRDMDELSYEEVAAGLGIGLSAAKMRIKRAREVFRQMYEAGTQ
jgi:RNA polymerase sigma-70 factor, ECF subfamily